MPVRAWAVPSLPGSAGRGPLCRYFQQPVPCLPSPVGTTGTGLPSWGYWCRRREVSIGCDLCDGLGSSGSSLCPPPLPPGLQEGPRTASPQHSILWIVDWFRMEGTLKLISSLALVPSVMHPSTALASPQPCCCISALPKDLQSGQPRHTHTNSPCPVLHPGPGSVSWVG